MPFNVSGCRRNGQRGCAARNGQNPPHKRQNLPHIPGTPPEKPFWLRWQLNERDSVFGGVPGNGRFRN